MAAPSRRYEVAGRRHVDAWIAHTGDVARRRKFLAWLAAASHDPTQVASTSYRRDGARPGRTLHVAVVPGAGCIVSYHVLTAPVRALVIVSVIDDPAAG